MTNPLQHFSPQSLSMTTAPGVLEPALPIHDGEDGGWGSGRHCRAVTWPPHSVEQESCWSWAMTHKLWVLGLLVLT